MGTTHDSIAGIQIVQHRAGYRFSIDAVLLAAFVKLTSPKQIVDLGAGTGIIGLLLAARFKNTSITLVELQRSLHDLALRNIELNSNISANISAVHADMREVELKSCDAVVINPPFRRAGSGKISKGDERAIARHELHLSLAEMAAVASRTLRARGRLFMVYIPERLVELMGVLRDHGLEPKRLTLVHGHIEKEAKIVLLEAVKGAKVSLAIGPPLVLYEPASQNYVSTIQKLLDGKRHSM